MNEDDTNDSEDVQIRGRADTNGVLSRRGVLGTLAALGVFGAASQSGAAAGGTLSTSSPAAGRYLEEDDDEYDFVGPAEWENGGQTNANAVGGTAAAVAGGVENEAGGEYAAVVGGGGNQALADFAAIGGGRENVVASQLSTVGGGVENETPGGRCTTVGGGMRNVADGEGATVGGGSYNEAVADYATIAGGGPSDPDEPEDTSNVVYAEHGFIGGGSGNVAGDENDDVVYATIAGGGGNEATASHTAIGGGSANRAESPQSTVGGGWNNKALGERNATVGGGMRNVADGESATVAGGGATLDEFDEGNEAHGERSTVGGGGANLAGSPTDDDVSHATVAGGSHNEARGSYATIPGGENNVANGDHSLAAGRNANVAGYDGTFVWGDGSDEPVEAEGEDQFVVQAGGGMAVFTESDTTQTTGAVLPAGEGTWASLSARAAKANVEPVDPGDVLAGVEDLDISTWNYTGNDDAPHIGPMAEEFHDAFGLGTSEERISTVDADGVALAAIQGLSDKLDEKTQHIDEVRAENEQLRETLADKDEQIDELETRLATLESQVNAAETE